MKFVSDQKLKDEFLKITPYTVTDEKALSIVKALRERIVFVDDFLQLSEAFLLPHRHMMKIWRVKMESRSGY